MYKVVFKNSRKSNFNLIKVAISCNVVSFLFFFAIINSSLYISPLFHVAGLSLVYDSYMNK